MIVRAVAWCVVIGVGVIISLPVYAAVCPLDGDYSDTETVVYGVEGTVLELEVPSEDRGLVFRDVSDTYLPRFVQTDDPSVRTIADIIMSLHQSVRDRAASALSFVHNSIGYASDIQAHGENEYWQLPYETLRLGTGDCEDKALLLASIYGAMGLDCVLVHEPNHVSVAVSVEGIGHTVDYQGVEYLTSDPTSTDILGFSEPTVEGIQGIEPGLDMWAWTAFFVGCYAIVIVIASLLVVRS